MVLFPKVPLSPFNWPSEVTYNISEDCTQLFAVVYWCLLTIFDAAVSRALFLRAKLLWNELILGWIISYEIEELRYYLAVFWPLPVHFILFSSLAIRL